MCPCDPLRGILCDYHRRQREHEADRHGYCDIELAAMADWRQTDKEE